MNALPANTYISLLIFRSEEYFVEKKDIAELTDINVKFQPRPRKKRPNQRKKILV